MPRGCFWPFFEGLENDHPHFELGAFLWESLMPSKVCFFSLVGLLGEDSWEKILTLDKLIAGFDPTQLMCFVAKKC